MKMIDSASASVSVARHLNKQHEREMVESRDALSMIFSSLKYLAAQGLAIRGKTEETSNCRQLLQLRSEDSEILKKWLQRSQKFKWLSSDISNEVLEIMAHAALRELVKEVKHSIFYIRRSRRLRDLELTSQYFHENGKYRLDSIAKVAAFIQIHLRIFTECSIWKLLMPSSLDWLLGSNRQKHQTTFKQSSIKYKPERVFLR